MFSNIKEFPIEIGVVLAIAAIVVIGRAFMSQGTERKRKNEDSKEEDNSKRSRSEKEEVADAAEVVQLKKTDLVDGQLKEINVGESNIVVVKDKEDIFAFGGRCSHAGAPLKNGFYCNGRVRCSLHGACFNARSGDIEDFPCVDAIQTFPVKVDNNDVTIKVNKDALKNFRRVPKMTNAQPQDKRVVAIVGAGTHFCSIEGLLFYQGPSGLIAAETLRQDGYTGRIIMIGKEPYLPYDRTRLSKAMSSKAADILLRKPEFFTEHGIETILGTEVKEFDAKSKSLTMSDGKTLNFDYAVVATGGDPRSLPVPGMTLANIYQVRVPDEANAIINNVDGKKVVIVGTSFIGMEAASCIAKKAASVIAIGMEKVPFERVLGLQIGSALQKLHEKNGVQFRLQRVVKEFIGVDGKVTQVVLDDGEKLDAEICIIGAGIVPSTKYVKPGTLEIGRDGSIMADKYLKAAEGVYVAGDLARYPYFYTGESVRVEHYGMAMYQGRIAAHNIMGKNVELRNVPFFWTVQFGKAIRYAGHALSYDEILFDGNVEDLSFVGYYVRKDQIIAAVAVGRDPTASVVAELMDAGKMPSGSELKSKNFKLV